MSNLSVLEQVSYPGVKLALQHDDNRPYLQVQAWRECLETGQHALQKGRKWFLSPHMTKSEVVQTALKAVLAWEEHEAREKFKYRGQAVFGPHLDVDALHEVVCKGRVDVRPSKCKPCSGTGRVDNDPPLYGEMCVSCRGTGVERS